MNADRKIGDDDRDRVVKAAEESGYNAGKYSMKLRIANPYWVDQEKHDAWNRGYDRAASETDVRSHQ